MKFKLGDKVIGTFGTFKGQRGKVIGIMEEIDWNTPNYLLSLSTKKKIWVSETIIIKE